MNITKNSNLTNNLNSISLWILLVFEGLLLLLMTVAFWYDNIIRPQWFWLFWLAIPVFIIRWRLTGRLWTHTRLHDVIIIFLLVTAFNYSQAVFQKESYLAAVARPLSGIWTFLYYVELSRTSKSLHIITIFTIGLGAVLAFFGLTSSQWALGKTGYLSGLIEMLPRLDVRTLATQVDQSICLPIVHMLHVGDCFNPRLIVERGYFSFNVNEIAGALSWVTPTLAGFALIPISYTSKDTPYHSTWFVIRVVAGVCFILLLLAMIFGQSRFALMGVFVSLGILIAFSPITKRWRLIASTCLGLLIVMQLTLTFNLFASTQADSTGVGLSDRDGRSVSTRLQIWDRGVSMMADHPFTGVGMYMFRTAVANEPYVIPYFQERNNPPPHAHNEWVHIAAEMGVFGILIFVVAQGVALHMLWVGWREGDAITRQIVLATFCGLLAHAIYGLGDTIALWDRLQFVLWWMLGLVGAQYVLVKQEHQPELEPINIEQL